MLFRSTTIEPVTVPVNRYVSPCLWIRLVPVTEPSAAIWMSAGKVPVARTWVKKEKLNTTKQVAIKKRVISFVVALNVLFFVAIGLTVSCQPYRLFCKGFLTQDSF